jgi:hypothetical protein
MGLVILDWFRLGLVGKRPNGKSKHREACNSETDFLRKSWQSSDWFLLSRNRVIYRVAVSTTVFILLKLDARNLLTY